MLLFLTEKRMSKQHNHGVSSEVWEMLKPNRPQIWRSEPHDLCSLFCSHGRVKRKTEPLCHYRMLFLFCFFSPSSFVCDSPGCWKGHLSYWRMHAGGLSWGKHLTFLCDAIPSDGNAVLFLKCSSEQKSAVDERRFGSLHPPSCCPPPFFTFCVFYALACYSRWVLWVFLFLPCDILFFS